MPSTPRLALPYPLLADSPDVPRDIHQLALAIEAAAIGWVVGDVKFSLQAADHTGFILCDGVARLRASLPIPYTSLIDSILTPHPDPTRVYTPDLRRRYPVGSDPFAPDVAFGATRFGNLLHLGSSGGNEVVQLNAAESGTNSNGRTVSSGNHHHSIHYNYGLGGGVAGLPFYEENGRQFDTNVNTSDAGVHDHALGARSADDAHHNIPPYFAGNFFVSTGGGGVGTGAAPSGTPHGVGGAVHLPAGVRTNVTHGLGTSLVSVTTWDIASGEQVDAGTEIESIDMISLFSSIDADVNVVIAPVGGSLP